MIVSTTEAAKILNISTPRLRVLLIAGRVEGAYKTGKIWLIPSLGARSLDRESRPGDLTVVASRTHRLFQGKPIISKGTRGPAPRWRNPRKPAKTVIHVNTHKIKQNQKHQQKQPVIIVKKGNTNQYDMRSKYQEDVALSIVLIILFVVVPEFGLKVFMKLR